MTTPVSSATGVIAGALARLSEDVPEALEGASVESVVDLLAVLRQLRQSLHSLEAFVEAEAVTRIPYSKAARRIGEHMVEIRGGTTKLAHWQHDDLAWAVLKPLCFDPATGELVPEVRDIVDKVRTELFAAASVGYWRTTRLKALGIDAGEYAERVESRRTVQLTPAVDETGPAIGDAKRAAQMREYVPLMVKFLEAHPLCERCGKPSTCVHHTRGREGWRLTVVAWWKAACASCNDYAETQTGAALAEGWLLRTAGGK